MSNELPGRCPVCGHPDEAVTVVAEDVPGLRLDELIMSSAIGRPLRPGERVHHKNGDGLDNRRANLALCAAEADRLASEPSR